MFASCLTPHTCGVPHQIGTTFEGFTTAIFIYTSTATGTYQQPVSGIHHHTYTPLYLYRITGM